MEFPDELAGNGPPNRLGFSTVGIYTMKEVSEWT